MASTSSHCFCAAEIHLVSYLIIYSPVPSCKLTRLPLPQLFFSPSLGCRAKGPGLCAAGFGPVLRSGPCSQGGQAGSTVSRRPGREAGHAARRAAGRLGRTLQDLGPGVKETSVLRSPPGKRKTRSSKTQKLCSEQILLFPEVFESDSRGKSEPSRLFSAGCPAASLLRTLSVHEENRKVQPGIGVQLLLSPLSPHASCSWDLVPGHPGLWR